jgi:hypothetical protein
MNENYYEEPERVGHEVAIFAGSFSVVLGGCPKPKPGTREMTPV